MMADVAVEEEVEEGEEVVKGSVDEVEEKVAITAVLELLIGWMVNFPWLLMRFLAVLLLEAEKAAENFL